MVGCTNIRFQPEISDQEPKCVEVNNHNMAKSPQLALLVITVFYAGFLLRESLAQRQICSYYGMNNLFYSSIIALLFEKKKC